MRVNFYATLRQLAGGKTVEVAVTGALTARRALKEATRANSELDAEVWHPSGDLKEHIKVFINGRQSLFVPNGLDAQVGEDDTLDVFPPVGGGSPGG